jgi:hypothetical protein
MQLMNNDHNCDVADVVEHEFRVCSPMGLWSAGTSGTSKTAAATTTQNNKHLIHRTAFPSQATCGWGSALVTHDYQNPFCARSDGVEDCRWGAAGVTSSVFTV